jgi:carboxylesterase type B
MKYILLIGLFRIAYGNSEVPIIETQSGHVSGVSEKSYSGYDYLAYYGIPFAEPPVGNLRFKVIPNKIK